jgi:hypothetical protein
MSIKSVSELLPLGFNTKHQSSYVRILKNFIFDEETKKVTDNLSLFIENANSELIKDLTQIQGIDLYNTSKTNKTIFMKFMYNILLICNLDYKFNPNKEVNSIQKILFFEKKLGGGAEGDVIKVCIKFADMTSPYFVLKLQRLTSSDTSDKSTGLLKEYLNYYSMNFINNDAPNFIPSIGLIICSSFINTGIDNISGPINRFIPGICNCNGIKYSDKTVSCRRRNYMLSYPFSGDTIEKMLESECDRKIFIINFNNIYKQIVLNLCIAQDKLGFLHKDLNLRNISIYINNLNTSPKMIYMYKGTQIILENICRVNIFDFGASIIKDFSKLESDPNYTNFVTEYKNVFGLNKTELSQDDEQKISLINKIIDTTENRKVRLDNFNTLFSLYGIYAQLEASWIDVANWLAINVNNFEQYVKREGKMESQPHPFSANIIEYYKKDTGVPDVKLTDADTLSDLKNFIEQLEINDYIKSDTIFMNELKNIKKDLDKSKNISEIYNKLFIESEKYSEEDIKPINHIDLFNLTKHIIDGDDNIKTFLDSFDIKTIVSIKDDARQVDIDGYNNNVYGENPKFDYKLLLKSFSDNEYANFAEDECIFNEKIKEGEKEAKPEEAKPEEVKKIIKFNNPSDARYFVFDDNDIYFNNVKISELPHPTTINERHSFTYAIIKNKYNNKFEINFGRIFNLTEIGAKHNIISYNSDILVSGELAIKKISDTEYEYVLNINSSKMNPSFSRLNNINKEVSGTYVNVFYYILMINLALNIFKIFDNTVDIKPSSGTKFKYGESPSERVGEKLIDYYTNKICPTPEFIASYNKFTKDNNINSCIDYKNDNDTYTNINQINMNNKKIDFCKHMNYTDDLFKNKYLKYKQKYLELKKKL